MGDTTSIQTSSINGFFLIKETLEHSSVTPEDVSISEELFNLVKFTKTNKYS